MPVLKVCGSIIMYIAGMMSDDRLQIGCLCTLMNIGNFRRIWKLESINNQHIHSPSWDSPNVLNYKYVGLANLLYYCYKEKTETLELPWTVSIQYDIVLKVLD